MKKLMLAGFDIEALEEAEANAREIQAARDAKAKRERAHRKVLRELASQGRAVALVGNTIAPGVPIPVMFQHARAQFQ